jgi:hypothetical protein
MIVLLLPCGFNTMEYSYVKAIIGICMLVDYSVVKKCQQSYTILAQLAGIPSVRKHAAIDLC